MPYLEDLMLRLASGVEHLPEEFLARQRAYFQAAQQADGGFGGRDEPSDLYYTSFGLRSLALLGALDGDSAARAARFLQSRLTGQTPIVDFLSLLYSAAILQAATGASPLAAAPPTWPQAVSAAIEQLRRPDGGYAKTPAGQSSSLYHTFLVVICQQLWSLPTPEPERIVDFVRGRFRDDGSFVEMSPMQTGGANPTAAGAALLMILGGLDESIRQGIVGFLVEMQNDEGGLRANGRIPIADLLSTFTGVLTLADLGAEAQIDRAAARRYVATLDRPEGGFHGAAWDNGHDVEYSFYGLAATALLHE